MIQIFRRLGWLLKRFGFVGMLFAAISALDQLQSAREVMRSVALYLREVVKIPEVVLEVLRTFREFFDAIAAALFFWIPENIQSMALVLTILFGEAILYYSGLVLLVAFELVERIFAGQPEKSDLASLREEASLLRNLHDRLEVATGPVRLSRQEADWVSRTNPKSLAEHNVLPKKKHGAVSRAIAQRISEAEAREEEIIAGIRWDRSQRFFARLVEMYLRNPPGVPTQKYTWVVGTLILCIAINYTIFPLSEHNTAFDRRSSEGAEIIRTYMSFREDYNYHIGMAFLYFLPFIFYAAAVILAVLRDVDWIGGDIRILVICAAVLMLAGLMGWDEFGFLSPGLCFGFALCLYLVALNTLFERLAGGANSILAIDIRRRGER